MIFLLLSLLLNSAHAKTTCDGNAFTFKSKLNMGAQGYWMQPAGDRYISYTGVGGVGSQIYDLQKRERVANLEDIDGYALPEGDLYIHPNPIRFFKLEEIIKKGDRARPVFTDSQHQGYYQSVAIANKEGDTRNVRVLTAEGRGRIQDYKVKKKSNGNYSFEKKYSNPVKICTNLDRDNIDFEIPILSRKGEMFATRDYTTNTTKLYKITMPSGNCTEMADLGVETDKVSFSFDDKKIAYSTSTKVKRKTPDGREYQDWSKQLHTFDIETKTSSPVTGPGEDVLYHGYRQDGQLMYTRRTDARDDDGFLGADLLMIDPSSTSGAKVDEKTAIEIGKAWGKDCAQDVDDKTAAAIGFRLNKDNCTEVTNSLANASEDAKNFCNTKSGGQAPANSGVK